MSSTEELLNRIDQAFVASQNKVRAFQTREVKGHHEREQRLEKLEQLLAQLSDVWRPRLEALSSKFGEKVHVKPSVKPGRREGTFHFDSELARIDLRFSVFTDTDVRNVIFYYDLDILPILMKYEAHSEISFPLESVDTEALASWMEDRIVSFVNAYLSLHENQYYLKGHMVEDPVAKVSFPKYAAGAKAEFDGKTYYFISDETRQEFAMARSVAGSKTS